MRARPLLVALLIGGLGLTQPVFARDKDRDRGERFGLSPNTSFIDRRESSSAGRAGLSPGQAARAAQERNGGGKVLSVDPAGDGYRVKLLRSGDVRVIFIPDER
jgi:hypothetical protein